MENNQSFNSRLMAAMADMENPTKSKTASVVTKNGRNYQYQYETLDQVLAVIRPALTGHGLALTQQQAWNEKTSSYVLRTIVFDDSEERVMDERPLRTCEDAQQAGSWETYMRRYALRTAFGLAGEDDDGQATVYESSEKPRGAYPSNYRPGGAEQGNRPSTAPQQTQTAKKQPSIAGLVNRINELVAQAVSMDINMDSFMESRFKGRNPYDLPAEELTSIGKEVKKLINDKKSLDAAKIPEVM